MPLPKGSPRKAPACNGAPHRPLVNGHSYPKLASPEGLCMPRLLLKAAALFSGWGNLSSFPCYNWILTCKPQPFFCFLPFIRLISPPSLWPHFDRVLVTTGVVVGIAAHYFFLWKLPTHVCWSLSAEQPLRPMA